MNKKILTLIISIITLTICHAQKIEMEKVFGGYKYTQNGDNLSLSELTKTVKANTKSFQLIKKAKTKAVFGMILGGIGGGLTGYPIGTAIGGGEPNWTLAAIGAGCLAIALPLGNSADKNIKQSVELYNSSLNPSTFNNAKTEFKIIGNTNGIGLAMNF